MRAGALWRLGWREHGDYAAGNSVDRSLTFNSTSYIAILLGNGDGSFRKGRLIASGPNPLSIAEADFNGDGNLDLIAGNVRCATGCDGPGSVSVMPGNGDGTFQPPQIFPVNGEFPLLAVADFNGDGKPDVATANGDSRSISVLLNTTRWPKTIKK